jgi:Outer membrane protein beta-barrel domain
MQRIILFLAFMSSVVANAQINIGIKAGLNFANVTNPAGINAGSRTGYMIGGFISPKAKKILGFRSEIILSRQGYDYKTNTNSGNVNLDYLLLPQLITLSFTKKFQLQAGGQAAFLLNAKVDSNGNSGNGSLFNYFKRFSYGVVGGAEISPISGLFIGARMNVSLNNLNKEQPTGSSSPGFVPKEFVKNNVVQLYAGWRF